MLGSLASAVPGVGPCLKGCGDKNNPESPPARWLGWDLVEKNLDAVPPLSKEVCKLDGILAKG